MIYNDHIHIMVAHMNKLCPSPKCLYTGKCKIKGVLVTITEILPLDIIKIIFELLDNKSKNIFSSSNKKYMDMFIQHRKSMEVCRNNIWDTFDFCNEEVRYCRLEDKISSIYDYESSNDCVNGEWSRHEQIKCDLHHSHKVECRYIVNRRDVNMMSFYLDHSRLYYIWE